MKARPLATTLATALAAILTTALTGAASGCAGAPDRPPLKLPAVESFHPGACRDAAGPILELRRFTYEQEGVTALPTDSYPFLKQRAEEILAVRDRAEPAVRDRMSAVLTAIGFVRIRPGKVYDPQLLRDLEKVRADLQTSCVNQA